MRILIADDDYTSRLVLSGILTKEGHEVVSADDGTAAWAVLGQPGAPSLAILDWMMPGMDGVEVVRRVRELKTDRPPYIIMLTARGDKGDIVVGLKTGANDYVAKPFDPNELRARIAVGERMVALQDALLESREALVHQASHDALTGLMNRRAILERFQEELSRASRTGQKIAIGMCDIDHFKKVNDTWGHQVGDEVLRAVATGLGAHLRDYDAVGRIGGEEFLTITPFTPGTDCAALYDRLRASIADTRVATRSGELSVTISVGVACSTSEGAMDQTLEAADRALYQAKNSGRNRVVLDPGFAAPETPKK